MVGNVYGLQNEKVKISLRFTTTKTGSALERQQFLSGYVLFRTTEDIFPTLKCCDPNSFAQSDAAHPKHYYLVNSDISTTMAFTKEKTRSTISSATASTALLSTAGRFRLRQLLNTIF
jgi:hypothetical protein